MRADRLVEYFRMAGWDINREHLITKRGKRTTKYIITSHQREVIFYQQHTSRTSPMRMTYEKRKYDSAILIVDHWGLLHLLSETFIFAARGQTEVAMRIIPHPQSIRVMAVRRPADSSFYEAGKKPVIKSRRLTITKEEPLCLALQSLQGRDSLKMFVDYLEETWGFASEFEIEWPNNV